MRPGCTVRGGASCLSNDGESQPPSGGFRGGLVGSFFPRPFLGASELCLLPEVHTYKTEGLSCRVYDVGGAVGIERSKRERAAGRQRSGWAVVGLIVDAYICHPDLALTRTIENVSAVTIRVVPHSATDPETGLFFFRVRDGDFAAFESALETDPTVEESSLVIESETDRVYRLRHTAETELLSPTVARVGGLMLEARSRDGGWVVRLQLPDREALADLWAYCEDQGMAFELERLYRQGAWESEGATGLTEAQREALLTAFEEGYFEEPRETSQQEVADLLGISSTAAGGRIRRGMSKLIETTLADRENDDDR